MNTAPALSAPPLDEVTNRLVAAMGPDRIILFGSHAWGSPDEDSDLDLLVIVPHSDQPPPLRAARAHRCLRGILFPVDVLVKTRAEVERGSHVPASLISEVLERGRVLYG
ncbi:MAG: nucleotidyltransferase domain-containing protein [bacterium]|nr:nucleotidyltransferase domain-containing protein [bacterium]